MSLAESNLASTITTIRDAGIDRHYEIIRRLNTGGMATVYLGRLRGSHNFSRLVALKAMHAHYAADATFSRMFVDEARISAALRHPNIVSTLDVITTGGNLLLVMEYIEGETLSELFEIAAARGEALPHDVGCTIVHDLLLGLHYAHTASDDDGRPLGIIHRDVSPQNVMIGRDGLARVCDFGIAKARGNFHTTETEAVRGKIPYMAPEQLQGKPIDARVDVYSVGVILWEVLTGQRLFEGDSVALISRILTERIPAPSSIDDSIPPELDAIVLKALARNPAHRFDSALEMAEAIAEIVPPANRATVGGCASSSGIFVRSEVRTAPPSSRRSTRRGFWSNSIEGTQRPKLITAAVLFVFLASGLAVGSTKRFATFTRVARAQSENIPGSDASRPQAPTTMELPAGEAPASSSPGVRTASSPSATPTPSAKRRLKKRFNSPAEGASPTSDAEGFSLRRH